MMEKSGISERDVGIKLFVSPKRKEICKSKELCRSKDVYVDKYLRVRMKASLNMDIKGVQR
jgi:hypothetical protein